MWMDKLALAHHEAIPIYCNMDPDYSEVHLASKVTCKVKVHSCSLITGQT